MKSNGITYYWGKHDLQVHLGTRLDPRVRIVYWGEFLIAIGMATIFVSQYFDFKSTLLQLFINAGACMLYTIACYRFISRMYFREQLIITPTQFQIIRQTPFSKFHQHFDWQYMSPLRYIGKDRKTDHPLKGGCFDYFGFDTQEKLVQDLHHDGNLYFEYRGVPVRFARGIYTWHAEEIVRMIQLHAGSLLVLDDEWQTILQESEWDETL
jgi:hypothetical protein